MKLVVIDGQSGRTGALLVERVRAAGLPLELLAVGTNAIATAAMMKAGAQRGATGENPVLVACRDAAIIAGPIGILMADALMGEITPAMAVAVGQSRAQKVLLPVNSNCGKIVVGVRDLTLSQIMDEAHFHNFQKICLRKLITDKICHQRDPPGMLCNALPPATGSITMTHCIL